MGASPRQRLSAAQRRRRAVELQAAGIDLRSIAAEVGYANASSAKRAIDRELKESADRERRKNAQQLFLAGVDLRSIAEQLQYEDPAVLREEIDLAIEESIAREHASTDERRRDEILRYNRLQAAFWPKAIKDKNTKAADIVLRCIAGRERLQGLQAPTRINVDAQRLGDEIIALLTGDEDEPAG
ncbi:hypothetical protein GR925_27375 [Streptomyces sp. HUCO-GS316]|uniref:hypothetical protein n=1 Tax=Streptomyces sp. HUCO-GS316 TaxID=2692198 RepID=UPI00136AAD2B|nr:hypothetical protein [Streptomyces sp. HUCO-GS316]MXM67050.1 hypothetical protein [Streptomyces sp. HUCO-GS316]